MLGIGWLRFSQVRGSCAKPLSALAGPRLHGISGTHKHMIYFAQPTCAACSRRCLQRLGCTSEHLARLFLLRGEVARAARVARCAPASTLWDSKGCPKLTSSVSTLATASCGPPSRSSGGAFVAGCRSLWKTPGVQGCGWSQGSDGCSAKVLLFVWIFASTARPGGSRPPSRFGTRRPSSSLRSIVPERGFAPAPGPPMWFCPAILQRACRGPRSRSPTRQPCVASSQRSCPRL
jgi:hypothetical protein